MPTMKGPGSRVTFSHRAPQAESVYLAGTFNDWRTDALPMRKDAGGSWTVSLRLEPGRHEYKFIVDGEWRAMSECPAESDSVECVANAFGTQNRVVDVA